MTDPRVCVAELQRVVGQLEDSISEEVRHYRTGDREAIGVALTDLARRLELARLEVLNSGPPRAE